MAFNHEWPYTDMGRANTDWEIMTVKRLEAKVDLKYEKVLNHYIMQKFDSLFAGLVYVPEDTRLKLYLGIVGDGEHVYTPGNETMTIL